MADDDKWPRNLSRREAARYLGRSVTVFVAEVKAGKWPAGEPIGIKGGRSVWDRKLLDATQDRHSEGLGVPAATGTPDSTDEAAFWKEQIDATSPRKRLGR